MIFTESGLLLSRANRYEYFCHRWIVPLIFDKQFEIRICSDLSKSIFTSIFTPTSNWYYRYLIRDTCSNVNISKN